MTKLSRAFLGLAVLALFPVVPVPSETASKPKKAPPASPLAVETAIVTAAPEDVGLSSERLERIGGTIQKSVDDGRIAGATSLVARHGRVDRKSTCMKSRHD